MPDCRDPSRSPLGPLLHIGVCRVSVAQFKEIPTMSWWTATTMQLAALTRRFAEKANARLMCIAVVLPSLCFCRLSLSWCFRFEMYQGQNLHPAERRRELEARISIRHLSPLPNRVPQVLCIDSFSFSSFGTCTVLCGTCRQQSCNSWRLLFRLLFRSNSDRRSHPSRLFRRWRFKQFRNM